MNATEQEIAAAEAYEELQVPSLFRQWAPIVPDSATFIEGDRVLNVACGTGVLAREAKALFGDSCPVTGLDAGAGMLTVAQAPDPLVDWRQGLAESPPFEDAVFNVVVSQFGLMFFQDRPGGTSRNASALAPGGRLAVAVWDSLDNSEVYPLEVELFERRACRDAADALRAPFVLGDKTELAAMRSLADAESIAVSTRDGKACFPSMRSMVEADLRGWLPVMGVSLTDDRIESILEESEQVLAGYVTDTGTVEFSAPAHIVTATRCI